jgi:zinc D-Ala-D-Ala carboxypeptidase
MQFSEYFTLAEFTASQTADRIGASKSPPPAVLARLERTAQLLDVVRHALGQPILVSSGYRSPEVNKAVGGSPTSAHVLGYAVDFICPRFGSPLVVARAISGNALLYYDQLIHEYGRWVHISFDPRFRRQDLTISGNGVQQGLHFV